MDECVRERPRGDVREEAQWEAAVLRRAIGRQEAGYVDFHRLVCCARGCMARMQKHMSDAQAARAREGTYIGLPERVLAVLDEMCE